jgi:DNA-binding LacI/PurR family transcriptional regulator
VQALFTAEKNLTNAPPGRRIRERVRELIRSGALAPGEKIPSTRELAALWQTHVPTVHAALTALVQEGLLVRVHGSGTYVRKRAERLTSVGIYNPANALAASSSAFLRAVYTALHEILRRSKIDVAAWADPRPNDEQSEPWEPVLTAARNREVQGVIMLAADPPRQKWSTRLPVATSHLGAEEPTSVGFDERQLAELSLRSLARQGCTSVGLISAFNPGHEDFYRHFSDVARDLSLEVRNEWIRIPAGDCGGDLQERFGYEAFRSFWRQPQHPSGLVVVPDSVARGVITGLLEESVRVPEELKLVIHRNAEVDLLCPLPVTFVDSSCREVAAALVEQVRKQFRGEPCAPVRVPYRIAQQTK